MRNYRKILLTGLAIALLPIASCDGRKASSTVYERNLAELEQTCAELTAKDTQGRVYEAVIGKYDPKESFTKIDLSSSSNKTPRYTSISNSNGRFTVIHNTTQEDLPSITSTLKDVFGKNGIPTRDDDSPVFDVGICAITKTTENVFLGDFFTLTKIGDIHDTNK